MSGFIASSSAPDTSNGNEGNYNDSHRLFLQTMLSHRILLETDAQDLYDKICQLTNVDRQEFNEFVSVINREINEIDLALRSSQDQRNGDDIIGLVNMKQDEVAQIATTYTPSEITYFRQMLELAVMADDEKFAVGSMVALRLGQQMKPPISQKDTQALIDRLVEDGWICLTPDGSSYTIDNRGLLELKGYLKEQYGDVIMDCDTCKEVIIMGERCQVQNCPARIHRHCADSQFRTGNPQCPICSSAWSRTNSFGLGLPL